MPIISPIQREQLRKDLLLTKMVKELSTSPNGSVLIKFITDLFALHERVNQKIEEVSYLIEQKVGPQGEDGKTPTEEYLLNLIYPLIPQVKNGEDGNDGHTPTPEEIIALIKPLIPEVKNGEDGKTPTDEHLISLMLPLIPEVKNGEDGKDAIFDIATVIEEIRTGKKLAIRDILGLSEELQRLKHRTGGYEHGGGDTVRAGSNVTIAVNADGTKTISASGGGSSINVATEQLVGTQVGSNVTLDLSGLANYATLDSILGVYRNGQLLTPITSWTRALDVITITGANAANAFLIQYVYSV
jgi:hypothetical protein